MLPIAHVKNIEVERASADSNQVKVKHCPISPTFSECLLVPQLFLCNTRWTTRLPPKHHLRLPVNRSFTWLSNKRTTIEVKYRGIVRDSHSHPAVTLLFSSPRPSPGRSFSALLKLRPEVTLPRDSLPGNVSSPSRRGTFLHQECEICWIQSRGN